MVTLFVWTTAAWAQTVPDRRIPPTVLAELRLLENRFEVALATDCDSERCFSKGCAYVDHAVADQPQETSLPGLSTDPGPGSVAPQEYLTRARCSFAYEDSVESRDVQALSRRLQAKLSKAWTVVSVDGQKLSALPTYLQEPPEPEPEPEPEVEEEPEPEPEPEVEEEWSLALAARELWTNLLPHFFWMIAVVLGTLAGTALIWAYRRIGRQSIEEQMLLAEIGRDPGGAPMVGEVEATEMDSMLDAEFVAKQDAAWTTRLEEMDPADPDPEIRALVRELLLAGELPLLAKAVLRFPSSFAAAFPEGGEVAQPKLELAAYLKGAKTVEMPNDVEFFKSLNRHALAAAVSSQADARIVRSLREDFGASGLAMLVGRMAPRPGALIFALAPPETQHEMVRLLEPQQVATMAEQLLLSNRMDPSETAYLFEVLTALRNNAAMPPAPPMAEVSDRGSPFDAQGALSLLLESVNPARRAALFGAALQRFHGSLPSWHRSILLADMLFELPDEGRTDLMLEVDIDALAAWISILDPESQHRLQMGLPDALRNSLRAVSAFESREQQLALAQQGRKALAAGFQRQLVRANMSFESVVHPSAGSFP
ncbi:MAG: hypothetical protein KTR31_18490 [Myxococcales bacterium]|nr:hypothetical protein [Myxococcales bacterium]